jgi:hypothetical protein
MTQWSDAEVLRTIAEIKFRSRTDPEFRALALSNARAAIAKVNPRPISSDLAVFFVEGTDAALIKDRGASDMIVVLPDPAGRTEEISDTELQAVAGGDGDIRLRT